MPGAHKQRASSPQAACQEPTRSVQVDKTSLPPHKSLDRPQSAGESSASCSPPYATLNPRGEHASHQDLDHPSWATTLRGQVHSPPPHPAPGGGAPQGRRLGGRKVEGEGGSGNPARLSARPRARPRLWRGQRLHPGGMCLGSRGASAPVGAWSGPRHVVSGGGGCCVRHSPRGCSRARAPRPPGRAGAAHVAMHRRARVAARAPRTG